MQVSSLVPMLGLSALVGVLPCMAVSIEDLRGEWSVTSTYASKPNAPDGGLSGSGSYQAEARLLRNGTLRITCTDAPITRSLFGLFSSDVRTVLDLTRGGGIKGLTRINNATVETVKGTWKQRGGALEATLYSSSRNGTRVTSSTTIKQQGADTLVATETRSDGLTATVVAKRSPSN